MRSKVHIRSHPLHPILVAFPIAFFTGAFLTDIIFLAGGDPVIFRFAAYLETGGIVFAILAAIPGIIDYVYTLPPESSAKKRGAKHGFLNGSMLFVFIAALVIRTYYHTSLYIVLFLELIGMVLLTVAGWLGGTLVYRNQIGVDHRYAHAGKWKEEFTDDAGEIELKELNAMKAGQMKLLHINNKRIVIGRTEEGFTAFDDYCTHRGASLADGVLICGTVQCPWHGSQFDVITGRVKAGPASGAIKTYAIEKRNGEYFLNLKKI